MVAWGGKGLKQPYSPSRHLSNTLDGGIWDQSSTKRYTMVEMMSWPVTVFRVLDRQGQPIGEVVQPKTSPLIGRGAGTVLLVRGVGGNDGQLDQH